MTSDNPIIDGVEFDPTICTFEGMWEPTGFDASNTSSRGDISFVDGTRTFTIEPQSGENSFWFWIHGTQCVKNSAENMIITDVEGLHYIYFDTDGSLVEAVNPPNSLVSVVIRNSAIVSIIYWDATNNEAVWFADERHQNQMDGATHSNLHFTRGAQFISGLALGDFDIGETTNDSGAQFSTASGIVIDEDIPAGNSEKVSTAGLKILYKDGALGNWRQITETGFPVLTDTTAGTGATGRLVYNQFTGGAWQLTTVTNNRYVLCHVIATNDTVNEVYAIVGENEYANVSSARLGATTEVSELVTSGLPGPEFVFVGTVIFLTNNIYGNSVKATTVLTDEGDNYVDWRFQELTPSGGPAEHGNLTGLSNDDHTQYLLVDGTRAMSGDLAVPSDTKVILNGSGGNTYITYNAGSDLVEIYKGGSLAVSW